MLILMIKSVEGDCNKPTVWLSDLYSPVTLIKIYHTLWISAGSFKHSQEIPTVHCCNGRIKSNGVPQESIHLNTIVYFHE